MFLCIPGCFILFPSAQGSLEHANCFEGPAFQPSGQDMGKDQVKWNGRKSEGHFLPYQAWACSKTGNLPAAGSQRSLDKLVPGDLIWFLFILLLSCDKFAVISMKIRGRGKCPGHVILCGSQAASSTSHDVPEVQVF